MSKTRNILLLILLAILVLMTGCEKKIELMPGEAIDLTRIIESTTGDFLVNRAPIVIILRDNEIITGKKDKKVSELDFIFEPSIKGTAIWQDKNTIHFQPHSKLNVTETYQCTILPAGRTISDSLVTPVKFAFQVIGQDVEELDCQITFEEGNSNKFRLTGKIKFIAELKLSELKKSGKIKYDNSEYKLNWAESEDYVYTFESRKLQVKKNADKLEFTLNGKLLQLPYDICRNFDINQESVLTMRQATMINEEKNSYIEIEFSDNIARDQDLYSLIKVVPSVNNKIDLVENIVRISGDYQFNGQYAINISKELKSTSNKTPTTDTVSRVALQDEKPQIKFNDTGVFLTSASNNNLYFSTMNVKKVKYEVTLVYENNLCQYLQSWNMQSSSDNWSFNNLNCVGNKIAEGDLEIGEQRNIWLQHELNISQLLPDHKYGIYHVKLLITKDDVLYRENKAVPYKGGHYNDPINDYYYYHRGTITKPFIVSDLAITYKQGAESSLCIINNVVSGKPVKGVYVSLVSYQNQTLAEGFTDKDGFYQFTTEEKPFYVTAQLGDQESVLKLRGDSWETSSFAVGGVSGAAKNLQAYIYTERGVYRPGDEINIAIVMRNQDGSFPENHPLEVAIYDSRYTKVFDTVLKDSKDGFYHLPYSTSADDPTGSWNLQLKVGKNTFNHELRIETIAPERLKLTYFPQSDRITAQDNTFDITLEARYLFGRAAAGLTANFNYKVESVHKRFSQPEWGDFSFSDAFKRSSRIDNKKSSTVLDEEGKGLLIWKRPYGNNFSSAGTVTVECEVIDKGGRASKENLKLSWDPWDAYVGIKINSSYLSRNKENKFEVILLDPSGKPLSGDNIEVCVYENTNYWWWEFDNYSSFRQSFKQAKSTRLLEKKTISSKNKPIIYKLPALRGRNILIEITHLMADGRGHTSSKFLYTSSRARGDMKENADILQLRADQDEYFPGDKAHISFPINDKARTLVTLEKADQIIDWWWYQAPGGKTQADISIDITQEMQPGIYATVSVIQSQIDNENDCPLRLYGIIPLKVTDKSSQQKLEMTVPEIIRPLEKFICRLQATPGEDTQFTVAVVDEGLLSLTDYRSPDAWEYFHRKEKLEVQTYDNYGNIIEVETGDITRRFSIGGGVELFQKRQLEKTEVKRFEPVSLFSGIITADKNGKAEMEFTMPDYLGAVRIMAVSVNGNKYGSASQTVTVRKELMLMATLPRALAPGDKFTIPLEVFSFDDKIKSAQASISAQGPLTITGESSQTVTLNDRGEGLVLFAAEMRNELTPVSVSARVQSGTYEHQSIINIPVRALQPYQMVTDKMTIEPENSGKLNIGADAVQGTESSYLVFSRPGFFQYNKHLKYLVRYPYGCLEQTTSSIFPQLFIGSLIDPQIRMQLLGDIDHNIEAGLNKLTKYQTAEGGFSYWRGVTNIDLWTSIYAAHFLIEATEKGYHIPAAMAEKAVNYLQKNGISTIKTIDPGLLKTQVYQLYVLARAGHPQINQMNYLLQNEMANLDNCDRWLLAGAFQAAGQNDIANRTADQAGNDVNTKDENFRNNYGSLERDRSIILAIASQLDKEKVARKLYDNLAESLNGDRYYSTQSRAFMLWALSSYAAKHPEMFSSDPVKGSVKGADDPEQSFIITENDWRLPLESCRNIEINLDAASAPATFTLFYDRIPAKPGAAITNESFSLSRKLTDLDGKVIDPARMIQGESYELQITLTRLQMVNIKNLALTQILPSGWEIINERLSGGNSYNRNADFVDIRDDRIMWFFDYPNSEKNNSKVYKVRIRAVTAGEFEMPPTSLEAMYLPDYTVILPGIKTKISR